MPIAEAEDEEVGEASFGVPDALEVRTDSKGRAEGFPSAEEGVAGFVRFPGVGSPGERESSAEVSSE